MDSTPTGSGKPAIATTAISVNPGVYSLAEHLERHFAKLASIGIQPDGSITRLAYSDEESAAMAYIRAEGEAFGLEGRYDPIGNLILSQPGNHSCRLLAGSHIDSVPRGGNYDGAAGVVSVLEALRQLRSESLNMGIDLVIWRGEEYTFNAVYKGSAAAFGQSEPHILYNTYCGQSLRDAILGQGFDPSYIDEGKPSFEPSYIDSIAGYLELHIEQGVRLERQRKDVGIVTSVAGDRRFLVVVEGRFDHSGATPMGPTYRCDVNLAIAHMQVRIDELGAQKQREGYEFTQTVGIVNSDPEIDKKYPTVHANSVTKVSGQGYFTLDIMSANDEFMDTYAAAVHRLIWQTAKAHGVTAVIEQTDVTGGLHSLDDKIQATLEKSATTLGYSWMKMASGAGHDAVIVAKAKRRDNTTIPVGMLFVPCRQGISHSRNEYVSPEQVARGSEVLRESLRTIASEVLE